jgi:hypothetical protein
MENRSIAGIIRSRKGFFAKPCVEQLLKTKFCPIKILQTLFAKQSKWTNY